MNVEHEVKLLINEIKRIGQQGRPLNHQQYDTVMLFVCRICVECKFHLAIIQQCRDCLKSKTMFVKSYMSKPFMIRKFIFKRVIPLWKFLHTSSAGFDTFTSAL